MASTEEHLMFRLLQQCVQTNRLTPQCQAIIQKSGSDQWKHFFIRSILQFEKQTEGDFTQNIGLLSMLWLLRQLQGQRRMATEIDPIGRNQANHLLLLLSERLDPKDRKQGLLYCELVTHMKQRGYFNPSETNPLYQSVTLLIKMEKWPFLTCLLQNQVLFAPNSATNSAVKGAEMKFLLHAIKEFVNLDFNQPFLQTLALALYPQLLIANAGSYENFTEANLTGVLFTSSQVGIGASWRSGGGPGTAPAVRSDRFYLAKDAEGNIYKLRFTALTQDGQRGRPQIEFALLKSAN